MAYLKAQLIHDTLIVLDADEAALKLFRAQRHEIVGSPFIDLFSGGDDMVELESLRLKSYRERDSVFDGLDFKFRRFDGTYFLGHTRTRHLQGVEWETTIDYRWETSED